MVLKDINDKKVKPEYIPKINEEPNLLEKFEKEEAEEVQESLVPYHIKSLIQTKQNDFEKHGFRADRKEKSFRDF